MPLLHSHFFLSHFRPTRFGPPLCKAGCKEEGGEGWRLQWLPTTKLARLQTWIGNKRHGTTVSVCVLVGACMASTCRHLLSFQPDGLVPADHRRVADVIFGHGALTWRNGKRLERQEAELRHKEGWAIGSVGVFICLTLLSSDTPAGRPSLLLRPVALAHTVLRQVGGREGDEMSCKGNTADWRALGWMIKIMRRDVCSLNCGNCSTQHSFCFFFIWTKCVE